VGVLKMLLVLFLRIFFQALFSSEDVDELNDDSLEDEEDDESFNNEDREILDFCFFGSDFLSL